ncbi:hypothetical protein Afil01_68280 [Actinorhabdospora filicis]|uniref:Excalibur calcium-binding domain-containing protein n=1 Tax=Actinorhabdospora filicis TaxID=1785913 RepID=A0A9W6ST45_9ACTN|nr:excalibur calcium-binding domain-containing protein [Actinorhabdospora filicis]GLZ82021.1 hypothetical protein Afil01_68280 [Actinorhabdospora filicis]
MVNQPPRPRPLTRKQTTVIGIIGAIIALVICGGCLNLLGLTPDKPSKPAADQAHATPTPSRTPSSRLSSPSPSPSPSASPSPSKSSKPPADDGDDRDGDDGKDSGDKGHDDPPPAAKNDPRYKTCKEANAHGYGPYRKGVDPEYDWYIDRDKDGLVCET